MGFEEDALGESVGSLMGWKKQLEASAREIVGR